MRISNEDQLQASCVIWFSQEHPELRGCLWANFSEQNPAQAKYKLSMGLIRGLPDMMFSNTNREIIGIEMKYPGTRQDRKHIIEQANWMIDHLRAGWFCDSLEMFKDIINGGVGIDPYLVLENCMRISKNSVSWDDLKVLK